MQLDVVAPVDAQPSGAAEGWEDPDAVVDPMLDSTPILLTRPEPRTVFAFCNDVAQKIKLYPTVASRYGFASEAAMAEYIRDNPAIRHRIKELRAIWFSDDNVEVRLRKMAGIALLEAMPDTSGLMFTQPEPKPMVQIDAMNAHAKIAGVSGPPPGGRPGDTAGGNGGGRFSVSIIFSGGKIETINSGTPTDAPTIEGEAA